MIQDFFRTTKKNWAFLTGLVLISSLCGIMFFLGENSYILVHDQFDGDVFAYILHAKHFPKSSVYPEIMNGLAATGMQMASTGTLLFYLLFSSVTAYLANICFVMVVGYIGMYLLLRQAGCLNVIAVGTALLFVFLPFYSVYGLTIMGVPLYCYGINKLQNVQTKKQLLCIYCLVGLYGMFSSFVLMGYAVLLLTGGVALLHLLRKSTRSLGRQMLACDIFLGILYAVQNLEIIFQVLGLQGKTSHKTEMFITEEVFSFQKIFDFFVHGHYHAVSNHKFLLVLIIGVFILLFFYPTLEKQHKRCLLKIGGLIVAAFLIALFVTLFHTPFVVEIRRQLPGALKAFQFDRFYWLYPTIWFLAAGMAVDLVWKAYKQKSRKVVIATAVVCAALGTLWMSRSNVLIKNVMNMVFPDRVVQKYDPHAITWKSFFAEDVFAQISQDIDTEKRDYRVVSLGMYPTVALYNGFYCLDGYSNNYPLEYKHEFYQIIADELEKDPILKSYFCDWGNRCYAFTHEIGFNYMVAKDSEKMIENLDFDLSAFAAMGGRYIFSAVEILSFEKYGLQEMGVYETEKSYYRVWVYEYPLKQEI